MPAQEDSGTSMLTFKIKLLHEQSDMTVEVSPSDSCLAIVQQVRVLGTSLLLPSAQLQLDCAACQC